VAVPVGVAGIVVILLVLVIPKLISEIPTSYTVLQEVPSG
jgi:hypothetical protein